MSNLNTTIETSHEICEEIQNIPFSEVWHGEACEIQLDSMKETIREIYELFNQLEIYKNKIDELNNYKDLLDQINTKLEILNTMDKYKSITINDGNEIKIINIDYENLNENIIELQMEAEKEKIFLTNYFNQMITYENGSYHLIPIVIYDVDTTEANAVMEYYFQHRNEYKFVASYDNMGIEGLYKEFEAEGGREYVRNRLKESITNAGDNGRQKVLNVTTEIFKLCNEKKIIIPYVNKGCGSSGNYVSTDHLASGVDCCGLVCYLIDKSLYEGIQWRYCSGGNGLTNIGKEIVYENWNQAKPGDVISRGETFNNTGDIGAHSAIVYKNIPEEEKMVIAQSSPKSGYNLKEVSYHELYFNDRMHIMNMDDVYNGVDSEARLNFGLHVDDMNEDLR